MELEERNESIKEALRHEFDFAPKDRAIQIYHTAKAMGYIEQAEEMASDIIIEFNINVTK